MTAFSSLCFLSVPPLLCSSSFINYLFNREWCLYRKILNRDPAVLIERQQGQYGKAEIGDFPVKTERSKLISSRFYGLRTKSKQKSHLLIGALIWPCIHHYQLHKTGELMHIKRILHSPCLSTTNNGHLKCFSRHILWENNALELVNQSTRYTGYKHKPYNKCV